MKKFIFFVFFSMMFRSLAVSSEEFEFEALDYQSSKFKIPGFFFYHDKQQKRPTIFWCHGGPHGHIKSFFLYTLAFITGANVVGFDYRGSAIQNSGYKTVAQNRDSIADKISSDKTYSNYAGTPVQDLKDTVRYIKTTYSSAVDSSNLVVGGG